MKVLLIDDWRDFSGATQVARNDRAGRFHLKHGEWDEVWMDYSLGYLQMNGLQILEWAERKGLLPDRVKIISTHPNGVPLMRKWLRGIGFIEEEGIWRRLKEGEPRPKRKVTVYM